MLWTVYLGAAPTILNVVMAYLVRAEGSAMHASIGTMSGCLLNIVLDPIFIMPWGFGMGAAGAGAATFISNCVACGYYFVLLAVKRGRTLRLRRSAQAQLRGAHRALGLRGRRPRRHPEPAERHRHDHPQQLHQRLPRGGHRRHGHLPEARPGADVRRPRLLAGRDAARELQLLQRQYQTHEGRRAPDAHGQPDTDGRHPRRSSVYSPAFSCGFSCATRPSSNMAAISSWA